MISKNTSIEFIPKTGDRIDDNIIVNAIAEGGMARVYKVKNESLEVFRVIKLLKMSSDIDNERFVTEARISANLNHPNIIQCYRFSKFRDKISYIEMEYVDGINLYYMINSNGRIPIPVVLSIVYYICKALHALHNCSYILYDVERFGVVHRDIKPANIIISRKGEVKLADFGIAKPRDLSIHTSMIQVVGSIFYLSPEQLRKDELDFRSDIYSLGCVMYEMITAKKAFDQSNISDIVVAKINNSYDADSLSNCSEKTREVIAKCLNPVKADRYDTIDEVSEEIGELLKEFEIDDPQETIYRYVRNPSSFLSLSTDASERKIGLKFVFLIPLLVTLMIIALFSVIVLKKRVSFREDQKAVPTAIVTKSVEEEKPPTQIVPSNQVRTVKKSKKAAPKKSTSSKEETPAVQSQDLQEKLVIEKSLENAFFAFRRSHYNKAIKLLSDAENLNDTLFLCLLGSLAETGDYTRLAKLGSGRIVNDGYYYYLKGRVNFSRGQFDDALRDFLKALTIHSFYKRLSYHTNYYIARSKTGIYLKTPNIVNKNVMLKSFERFTSHFCTTPGSAECIEIQKLYEDHQ